MKHSDNWIVRDKDGRCFVQNENAVPFWEGTFKHTAASIMTENEAQLTMKHVAEAMVMQHIG